MNKHNQPNFMIIGAMKAATTSLYTYLIQHPEVFMSSIKEPKFFNNLAKGSKLNLEGKGFKKISNFDQYYSLFNEVKNEVAIGEASPSYLFDEKCAELIYKYLPETKIIAILRQPIDRAYSNFLHARRSGKEKESSFELAFAETGNYIDEKQHFYKEKGFYTEQLDRYYKLFPSKNIKILLFEDVVKDPIKTSKEVFDFLNVDSNFIPEIKIQNKSGVPKGVLGWILMQARYYNLLPEIRLSSYMPDFVINCIYNQVYKAPKKLDSDLKNRLTHKYYKKEINKLEGLLSRDLNHWLS